MKNFFNKYKYQLLLFIVVSVLFFVNYKSGTYLSGWDNLQTELNPGLAVKRAFFSVWEEYQSFGLTAGMAHAADLPRAVFLWIMSFIIPQNMIRYFYHFLMLLLGGMGAFVLFKKTSAVNAFFGALFYMLNLGTVQIFYLPFESFSTFFALLPWGIWAFLFVIARNIVTKQSQKEFATSPSAPRDDRKAWLLFFLINLLGTPAFYTQQLFVVYALVLGCVGIGLIRHIGSIRTIKKMVLAFFLIIIINSFWLLPQLYFLKTNGQVVTEAKNNTLSTDSVYFQNFEKGTLNNFFRLEGFYFDLKGRDNTFLFAPWKDHFAGVSGVLPYAFGLIGLMGLIGHIRKRENANYVLIFFLCTTGLLLATPPFSWINELARQIPIINQIFRSPFTKFVIPYSLVYSYFVAQGLSFFGANLKKVSPYIIVFILLYSLPSFKGYFFSPEMKVAIPDDYQSVINYFKSEGKDSRIALLPDYTFWGWFFNKWGYNGSGFLWYGIEQPIVSRTFDVWSKTSESYFWESKTAFEAEDINKLIGVLDKYNIDYLLLDKSLIPVVSSYKALQYDRVDKLLTKSAKVTPIYYGENIYLYKINHDYFSKNFISITSDLHNIAPQINLTNDDQAFVENGFYDNNQNPEPDIIYPFLSLTSQINSKENNWQFSEDDNYFYLSTPITFNLDDYKLFLTDKIYEETVLINDKATKISTKIEVFIQNNNFTAKIGKKIIKNFNVSIDQTTDYGFTDDTLSQNTGYLVKVRSFNKQGFPLFFYIIDDTKKQSYLEDRLKEPTKYFILSPKFEYGLGYTFAFQNKSFLNFEAINKLDELSIYLFPYQALKEMKFVRNEFNKTDVKFTKDFDVKKPNYFTYKVTINPSTSLRTSNLILFQSYSPGWVAFQNGKLLDHVLVNNWANGWILDDRSLMLDIRNNNLGSSIYNLGSITIVFWPQYLEFAGFILLAIAFLRILLIKQKHE